MIRVVHPGSRILMLTFSHPGSRGQKGTQSLIPDPDPQHCEIQKKLVPDPRSVSKESKSTESGGPDPQQLI
jgi:hypothetical protein